jgi:hypothetical protein
MQKTTNGGTLETRPARPGCAGDLVCEAERYLALVDVFRAEGYEPRWRQQTLAHPSAHPSLERNTK